MSLPSRRGLQASVFVALSLCSPIAPANDFTAGGSAADIVPLKETRIEMASEDIIMKFKDGHWLVNAHYVFNNPTDADINLQVGFPEFGCSQDADYDCQPDAFHDLRTRVAGKDVSHRKGSISKNHPWSGELGTVWLFDALFTKASATVIDHSYRVFMGSNLSFVHNTEYVTQTGKTWEGKIGKASFRVLVPVSAHTVSSRLLSKPRWVHPPGQAPHFELEFQASDWIPPKSISASFESSAFGAIDLGSDRLERSGVRAEDECTHVMNPTTAEQLRMCTNLIYAIAGRPFKSKKLSSYFYGNSFDWRLKKTDPPEEKTWERGLRANSKYTNAWLSAEAHSMLRHLESLKHSKKPTAGENSSLIAPARPPVTQKSRPQSALLNEAPIKKTAIDEGQAPETPPSSSGAPLKHLPKKRNLPNSTCGVVHPGQLPSGRGVQFAWFAVALILRRMFQGARFYSSP